MVQDTYEQEIDLKDLMFYVLKKWRRVLLTAIVLCVLLGGYKLIVSIQTNSNPQSIAEQKEAYTKALEAYEMKEKSLEQEIENITRSLQEMNEYQDNSILMKISPYNKAVAEAGVYIQAADDMAEKNLVGAYASLVRQEQILEDICDRTGIEVQYLQELISVNDYIQTIAVDPMGKNSTIDSSMKKNIYLTENANVLEITVSHTDKKAAQEILDALLMVFQNKEKELSDTFGTHTIKVINQGARAVVDTGLSDLQQRQTALQTSLNGTLTIKQGELDKLEKPAAVLGSTATSIKQGVKYGVLGGVLGGFMAVFFASVNFLMSDKLYGEKELKKRFGLKILGILPNQSDKKPVFAGIDRWLEKLEGISTQLTSAAVYEIIAANTKNYVTDGRTILITGGADESDLDQIAEHLKPLLPDYELIVGGDMMTQANTLQKLSQCEGVILVEERKKTTYTFVQQELETIENVGKYAVGAIVL